MTQSPRPARALSSPAPLFSIPHCFPAPGKRAIGEMTKVHPNASAPSSPKPAFAKAGDEGQAEALTVWRKSLLFNGNGFTVFDAKGNLLFRVDNYASGNKGEVVLMDAAGKPLLTIRKKKLSLGEHWLIYEGEETTNPCFSVKKRVSFLQSKSLAHVAPCASASGRPCTGYEVEGSYAQRCCYVYDESRRQLAEIRRKVAVGGVAFGHDVFSLLVHPGFDASVAMAIVILLEQMFGSRGSSLLKA